MGGFQFNGCGAKDYFSKVKYLGEQMCPNCKKIAPLYLEKGRFKVSVFWVPTITLKERYAIMCEKCKEGVWIEDDKAYKILSGSSYNVNETVQNEVSALSKCPRCGAETDGPFCGKCGAPTAQSVPNGIVSVNENITITPKEKCICSKCGAEVTGSFCGNCGTKYIKSDITGGESDEDKGGEQGISSVVQAEENTDTEYWECSLCGTKNPQDTSNCNLCGCDKEAVNH